VLVVLRSWKVETVFEPVVGFVVAVEGESVVVGVVIVVVAFAVGVLVVEADVSAFVSVVVLSSKRFPPLCSSSATHRTESVGVEWPPPTRSSCDYLQPLHPSLPRPNASSPSPVVAVLLQSQNLVYSPLCVS